MAKTRGTGLLMVWTDIDEEHEAVHELVDVDNRERAGEAPSGKRCIGERDCA